MRTSRSERGFLNSTVIMSVAAFVVVAGILTWRYISVNSDSDELPVVDAVNFQAREDEPVELPPQISTAFSDIDTSAWVTIESSISNFATRTPEDWLFSISTSGIDPTADEEVITLQSASPGASPNIYYCVDIRVS